MFVGHYAVAFAAKAVRGAPSLATGFVAVQLIDFVAFTLAYFGIENWRPNPSLTGLMPLDLYDMPFTHSLLACGIWAIVAAIVVATMLSVPGRRAVGALLTAGLVLSHWLLDLIVHRHDLGILGNEAQKLGFALWDQPSIAMSLELGLLFAGFAIYQATTTASDPWGKRLPWLVLAMLLLFQAVNWFGPPPVDRIFMSTVVLLTYALCVGAAWLLDRSRSPKQDTKENT